MEDRRPEGGQQQDHFRLPGRRGAARHRRGPDQWGCHDRPGRQGARFEWPAALDRLPERGPDGSDQRRQAGGGDPESEGGSLRVHLLPAGSRRAREAPLQGGAAQGGNGSLELERRETELDVRAPASAGARLVRREEIRTGTAPRAKGYFYCRNRPVRNSSYSGGGGGDRRDLALEAALLALRVRGRLLRMLLRLLGRAGLAAVRNAALVGRAHGRKSRGDAETGHERRQLAGSQLHVLITSMTGWVSPPGQATEPAKGLRAGAQAFGELEQRALHLVARSARLRGVGDHEGSLREGGDQEMRHRLGGEREGGAQGGAPRLEGGGGEDPAVDTGLEGGRGQSGAVGVVDLPPLLPAEDRL